MVRNLPRNMTQRDLMDDLTAENRLRYCDFVYMPQSFETGKGKGYAFINFITADGAEKFTKEWHGKKFVGAGFFASGGDINVAPAEVQGLEANLERLQSSKMMRIRNRNLQPYVAKHNAGALGSR